MLLLLLLLLLQNHVLRHVVTRHFTCVEKSLLSPLGGANVDQMAEFRTECEHDRVEDIPVQLELRRPWSRLSFVRLYQRVNIGDAFPLRHSGRCPA